MSFPCFCCDLAQWCLLVFLSGVMRTCGAKVLSSAMLVFRFVSSFPLSRIVPPTAYPSQSWLRGRGKSGAAGTRRGTNWNKRKTNCQGRTEVKESFVVEVSGR